MNAEVKRAMERLEREVAAARPCSGGRDDEGCDVEALVVAAHDLLRELHRMPVK